MFTGNSKNLEDYYILLLLFLSGRLGRRQISKILEIGEGRVKRILAYLYEKSLLDIKKAGGALSKKGLDYLFNFFSKLGVSAVGFFDAGEICENCIGVGFHFQNFKPKKILDIRDEAVRGGAKGALIIYIIDNKWLLPPETGDLREYCPCIVEEMKETFKIGNNDTILLVFAESLGKAIRGGLNAVLLASNFFVSSINQVKTYNNSRKEHY